MLANEISKFSVQRDVMTWIDSMLAKTQSSSESLSRILNSPSFATDEEHRKLNQQSDAAAREDARKALDAIILRHLP